jgi:hypothetical protein
MASSAARVVVDGDGVLSLLARLFAVGSASHARSALLAAGG